jgi:predicted branched-subunit amino acid permease
MLGWTVGTVVGVFLGNIVGDAERYGLDVLFPASLLAIIGPLLRQRSGAIAAAVGGGLCLVLLPVAPAGIPVIASLVGAFVAMAVPDRAT